MGELIAVLSGKGGTGKTSVCGGVTTALARMGHKVLAVDCDMGLQNLDISSAKKASPLNSSRLRKLAKKTPSVTTMISALNGAKIL